MAVFVADCYVPGLAPDQLAGLQHAIAESSRRSTAAGQPIRYLRSVFLPGEARCLCLFEAPRAKIVQEVSEAAQLPFTQIVAAYELTLERSS